MLSFSFIPDEYSMHTRNTGYAGGIEYEEFELAQELRLIENHLDYYGKFRWISQNIQHKRTMLTPSVEAAIPNFAAIIKQAFASGCGLVAFGD